MQEEKSITTVGGSRTPSECGDRRTSSVAGEQKEQGAGNKSEVSSVKNPDSHSIHSAHSVASFESPDGSLVGIKEKEKEKEKDDSYQFSRKDSLSVQAALRYSTRKEQKTMRSLSAEEEADSHASFSKKAVKSEQNSAQENLVKIGPTIDEQSETCKNFEISSSKYSVSSNYNESSPESHANEPESHKENTVQAVQTESAVDRFSAVAVGRSNSLKRSADEERINRVQTESQEQIEIRTRETDPTSSIFSKILNIKIHSRPETLTSAKVSSGERAEQRALNASQCIQCELFFL